MIISTSDSRLLMCKKYTILQIETLLHLFGSENNIITNCVRNLVMYLPINCYFYGAVFIHFGIILGFWFIFSLFN